jgi:hypothetical protein
MRYEVVRYDAERYSDEDEEDMPDGCSCCLGCLAAPLLLLVVWTVLSFVVGVFVR